MNDAEIQFFRRSKRYRCKYLDNLGKLFAQIKEGTANGKQPLEQLELESFSENHFENKSKS